MKKLSEEHYIVMDDSEIKQGQGDFAYQQNFEKTNNQIISIKTEFQSNLANDKNGSYTKRKITHSTQPESLGMGWMQSVQPLFLSEVKELLGVVDVEKNMWYERNLQNPYSSDSPSNTGFKKGFELGYNQALEDNKEKKNTEEDIRKAWEAGMRFIGEDKGSYSEFIQSLQPKTEWEVEMVDGKLKLKS